ncbi:hypothetical protein SBOR_10044 [Sclerotinia borealis F-4128]|uniref:2EXR domain-containing protein n=1 Tax=Sclerotinia borealis (strain F-4128) TaxID=1432307 RepID=W9C3Q7_SCLBF|nr:hypothetical protein SBOR_10044 [Sclerotinia borealis F-4128]
MSDDNDSLSHAIYHQYLELDVQNKALNTAIFILTFDSDTVPERAAPTDPTYEDQMKDKSSHKFFAHKWVRSQTTRGYVSPYKTPINTPPPQATHNRISLSKPPTNPPSLQPTNHQLTRDPRLSLNYILHPTTPHCFNKGCIPCLPVEVRHMIWGYARSRTISIVIHDDLICSRSPSPITLRIDRESRSETKKTYKSHKKFYILGTEHDERTPYPFFDPKVDSVVLMDSFMGCNPATSSTVFGFYGPMSVTSLRTELDVSGHMDVIQSLHIPAHAWVWNIICRSPRAGIWFKNLTEIVFQGGEAGLRNEDDIEKCKEVVRGCFERISGEIDDEDDDDDQTRIVDPDSPSQAEVVSKKIKVPEVRVCMPKGLGFELMFEEEKLGMESVEERKWVMSFINKVKHDRG